MSSAGEDLRPLVSTSGFQVSSVKCRLSEPDLGTGMSSTLWLYHFADAGYPTTLGIVYCEILCERSNIATPSC